MKTLSLKLDDIVFEETEQLLETIKKPRNRYINEALQYYNRLQKRKIPDSICTQIPGRVARFGTDYTNFEELIDLIQASDYIYTSDSLPLHLAYLCRKPHFILYPEGGKQDFFTPDALASKSFCSFTKFHYV